MQYLAGLETFVQEEKAQRRETNRQNAAERAQRKRAAEAAAAAELDEGHSNRRSRRSRRQVVVSDVDSDEDDTNGDELFESVPESEDEGNE